MDIHADLVYSHTRYGVTQLVPIGIYQSLKNGRKCCLRWLGVKFEWCSVLPALPVGGHLVYRQIAKWRFALCHDLHQPSFVHSSSFTRHKVRQSYVSRTVWHRISKFYTDIQTEVLYSHTRYDVTSCFRSAFIEVRKMLENVATGGFRSNIWRTV